MMSQTIPPSVSIIGSKTITNTVYKVLRSHIINQTFVPGRQLQVIELAQRLGVSRTPVKDALGALPSEGLVKIVPRRGTIVADMGSIEISENYEVLPYWGSKTWAKGEGKAKEVSDIEPSGYDSTDYPPRWRMRACYSRTIDTTIVTLTTDTGADG